MRKISGVWIMNIVHAILWAVLVRVMMYLCIELSGSVNDYDLYVNLITGLVFFIVLTRTYYADDKYSVIKMIEDKR